MEKSSKEDSFNLVLTKSQEALGNCLLALGDQPIETTAAFSAMMWAVISLAKEANARGEQGRPELLVDFDMVARFSSLMMSTNWKLDSDMASKFKDIAFHKCNEPVAPELLN